MPAKAHIAFYANNSHLIGAGHIMRLYALAEVAAIYFDVTFLYKTCSEALLNKLKQANFTTVQIDAPINHQQLQRLGFSALFIDDYALTLAEWQQLRLLDTYLVKLDDALDNAPILADLIINPAPNCSAAYYQALAPKAQLCLGPTFTYLRQEFAQTHYQMIAQRPNILISLGGTDTKSLALPLVTALMAALPDVQMQLLLGKTHQDQAALTTLAKHKPNLSLICDPPSVAAIMMQSGLAISAAGGTLGELASQGVPTLALVTVDNQVAAMTSPLNNTWYRAIDVRTFVSSGFDANGFNTSGFHSPVTQVPPPGSISQSAINHDLLNVINAEALSLWHKKCLRQTMSDIARQLIDSQGCQRVINQLCVDLQQRRNRHDSNPRPSSNTLL
ncbi:UDP-2,4-diacetamido-2,4,6-trideoxy-beta-L-altropyranose hydrolase [Shewanella sp. SNU WT4]|uniref:UDP-2,4-diacetamido-2,4, 6-trideoxy-beta-L-altropyranose hydrolase n=1 Tax=Shewanella sp. SNU WT4 TaxID=2590015 RepID=UPI00143DA212|nr:UDP-2,4-diacetamido-2,4,6-trideoxy-beta-L-altropyranose hydrolase [Shewanella sp. SNU WT4]